MIACLLRYLGIAIIDADRLLELELVAELHAHHIADITALKATIGNATDIAAHIRRLTQDLRQTRTICAAQQEQLMALRDLVCVLEEQNELLLADSGAHLADEIGRTLEGQ